MKFLNALEKSFVNNFYFDLSCPLKHRSLCLAFFSKLSVHVALNFSIKNYSTLYTVYSIYFHITHMFRMLEDNKVKTRGLQKTRIYMYICIYIYKQFFFIYIYFFSID